MSFIISVMSGIKGKTIYGNIYKEPSPTSLKKKHLSQDLKGESKLPRQGDCPSLLSTYYVPGTAPGIRIRERNYQQIFLKELSLLGVNRFPSDDLLGSDGIIFKMF